MNGLTTSTCDGLNGLTTNFYNGLNDLNICIKNKYLVSSITVGILCVVTAFAVTRIPYYQFGKVDSGQFFVNAEASITSSVRDSEQLAIKMENIILSELNEDELESLHTNVGVSFKDFSRFDLGSQYVQIVVSLKKRSPQGFVDWIVTPLFNLSFDSYGKRDRSEKEIINELESTKRGVYSGAVGYLGFDGDMNVAIAIRTAVIKDNMLYVQAGAGIVADSLPNNEWVETQNKAKAILKASELVQSGITE